MASASPITVANINSFTTENLKTYCALNSLDTKGTKALLKARALLHVESLNDPLAGELNVTGAAAGPVAALPLSTTPDSALGFTSDQIGLLKTLLANQALKEAAAIPSTPVNSAATFNFATPAGAAVLSDLDDGTYEPMYQGTLTPTGFHVTYPFRFSMPGAPVLAVSISLAQLKANLTAKFGCAGVSTARILELYNWDLGGQAMMGMWRSMLTHELKTLDLMNENTFAVSSSGNLTRAEKQRTAASITTFSDLMDMYANLSLILAYLLGPTDPRVAMLPWYFQRLRAIHNEGVWDVMLYDYNFRSQYWTDLATALLSCGNWFNLHMQCAARLPQRQGGTNVIWGQGTVFGQNNIGNAGGQHFGGGNGTAPQPCKNYNKGIPCSVQPCPRPHICDICSAPHPHKNNH